VKTFVLIMHILTSNSVGITSSIATQEFNSQQTCNVAEKAFENDASGIFKYGYAICVEK
jgi:hypothetical protein